MLGLLGMPPEASAHAADIDRIIVILHWLMLVLAVGWGAFFIFTLVKFRQSANPKANPEGIHASWSKWIEAGVVAIEAIVLLAFAIPAWNARVAAFPAEKDSVIVRVVAEQFAWNIHYPGPDGKFGKTDITLVSSENPLGLDRKDPDAKDDITTINQLNLPVDRNVIVHISSKDVIHSFALPQMRVKQDAVPGMVQNVWFKATTTGAWEIPCSQLCGLGHYRMRGFYTIQSQADFDKWQQDEEKNLVAAK